MTKLEFINKFIFQWLFVRLTRHEEKKVRKINSKEISYGVDVYYRYSIQWCILPLTGWWSNFVYLNKRPKFLYLTKYKIKS